jgi:hypothetical protein
MASPNCPDCGYSIELCICEDIERDEWGIQGEEEYWDDEEFEDW